MFFIIHPRHIRIASEALPNMKGPRSTEIGELRKANSKIFDSSDATKYVHHRYRLELGSEIIQRRLRVPILPD
jgi:hypothetical protein